MVQEGEHETCTTRCTKPLTRRSSQSSTHASGAARRPASSQVKPIRTYDGGDIRSQACAYSPHEMAAEAYPEMPRVGTTCVATGEHDSA
jgi:hypothetical protein